MQSSQARNWLLVLFVALPCALYGQFAQVPDSQCVYRLGDNPAWAAANVDPIGWKPYAEYRMTGDAWVLWVRCQTTFDTKGIQHPALVIGSDGPEQRQVFVDGQSIKTSDASWLYPISPRLTHARLTVALRVVQNLLPP